MNNSQSRARMRLAVFFVVSGIAVSVDRRNAYSHDFAVHPFILTLKAGKLLAQESFGKDIVSSADATEAVNRIKAGDLRYFEVWGGAFPDLEFDNGTPTDLGKLRSAYGYFVRGEGCQNCTHEHTGLSLPGYAANVPIDDDILSGSNNEDRPQTRASRGTLPIEARLSAPSFDFPAQRRGFLATPPSGEIDGLRADGQVTRQLTPAPTQLVDPHVASCNAPVSRFGGQRVIVDVVGGGGTDPKTGSGGQ